MANDVQYLIDMLYEMVDGAKGVAFSPDKCIIIREDALDLLDRSEEHTSELQSQR